MLDPLQKIFILSWCCWNIVVMVNSEFWLTATLKICSSEIKNPNGLLSFYWVTNHLDLCFQRRRFLKFQPINTKMCLWQPCFCPIKLEDITNIIQKHGCHRHILVLIGWNFRNLLLWKHKSKWFVTL
jgi:hypothetical protein